MKMCFILLFRYKTFVCKMYEYIENEFHMIFITKLFEMKKL